MSVFVTLWNRDGEPVAYDLPQTMLRAELNPINDGMNTWVDNNIVLAHQHYWITPEEIGEKQPLQDDLTKAVIVGSIRLDNRHELYKYIGNSASEPDQLSDAQIVLEMYNRFGIDLPERIQGDFGFVIWDPGNQQILAVRDRLGTQEIVYFIEGDLLIIASSVKMLLQHPDIPHCLNEKMVADYLSINLEDNCNTFYQSIYHLAPAHFMVVNQECITTVCYWEIDLGREITYSDDYEYVQHYLELLSESVRNHLRSSYPVGISLSGGLDSSTLACLAAEFSSEVNPFQESLSTFSYVFDEFESCDERNYIIPVQDLMAKFIPIRPHLINGDRLFPVPANLDWTIYPDFPFSDSYGLLVKAVLEAAKNEGIRSLLNGSGGDNLYSEGRYIFADLIYQMRFAYAVKTFFQYKDAINIKHHLFDYGIRALVPQSIKQRYRKIFPAKYSWEDWINPSFAQTTGILNNPYNPEEGIRFNQPGKRNRYLNLFHIGLATDVTIYNKIAWKYGVVYEFPFISSKIWEFILSLPPEQLNLPGVPRRILRNSMVNRLPDQVRKRTEKAKLSEIFNKGVYDVSWSEINHILKHPQVIERGWVRQDWLSLELSRKRSTFEGLIFWIVLSLELWLKKYW